MVNPLFPRQADNSYRGLQAGLWLFGTLLTLRTVMSVNSIFNGREIVQSADGIPLQTFTSDGAQTVVTLFALLSLANLVVCVLGFLVLIRYRTLVPLMFTVLLAHHGARYLIHQSMPIPRTGEPPASIIHLVLLTLMVAGLVLSLWKRRGGSGESSSAAARR